MILRRLKRGDVLEVIWNDAWTPSIKGWIGEHECGALEIKTVGIFWEQDKDYVYTYGCVNTDEKYETILGNPFFIPKGCIKSVRVLKNGV